MTALWFIWCVMLLTFHVTHPEPYCEIRGSAAAPADNCAAWLKACDSVRSRRRDSTAVQFFCHAYDALCVGSRRELWDTGLLQYPLGAAVHTHKKKEWHRLWEIYESDKYVLFDVTQNSFSALPWPGVQVIDGRTVRSPCPLLELFMLCFPS